MEKLPEVDGKCPSCHKDNRLRSNGNSALPSCCLTQGGGYIVGRSLGRGGFGITYVGKGITNGSKVAIKEYFPASISERASDGYNIRSTGDKEYEVFEEGKQKALVEARTIVRMGDIPNVVRVYNCFRENNTVYIIMEYVDGETLSHRVEKKGAMKWEQGWAVMHPIAMALESIHRRAYVHQDVSPDNVMIRKEDGQSILLDFGAASGIIADGQKHDNVRKDGYAALEQYQDYSRIDGRTDEYAWSATLYYALTGKRPPSATQRSHDAQALIEPRKLHAKMSKETQSVLLRGMAVNPQQRYESMNSLVSALKSAQGHRTGKTHPGLVAAIATFSVAAVLVLSVGLMPDTPGMVRTHVDIPVYDRPNGQEILRLPEEGFFSVLGREKNQGKIWYRVGISTDHELKLFYVSSDHVEVLNSETGKSMIRPYQIQQ